MMTNNVGVATSGPRKAADASESAAEGEDESKRLALSFDGVSRAFPGVQALDDVSLEVMVGEVHAIVGENGAGKSTLMAIASGALAADNGTVTIAGTTLSSPSPTEARDLGLAICRQTPSLMGDLSVAENFAIAIASDKRPRWSGIGGWSRRLLDTWAQNRTIDPKTFARSLDPAARFMVEISKAVSQQPKVLLLDEPTEALGVDETELLFGMIRELAAAGTAVVYISHRIPDVIRISDRISVLRDGVLRGTHDRGTVSEDDIVQAIVGTPLEFAFPPKLADDAAGDPVLSVSGLHGEGFSGVALEVRTGEIVGISGVEGNGQSQLIRALAGLGSRIGAAAGGEVKVAGRRLRLTSPGRAQGAGIVYLPADRHEEGIWSGLGVRENITATTLGDFAVGGFVRGRREARAAGDRIRELDIKTSSAEAVVGTLSGGNQQKTVIARATQSGPRVILAHEPTQGVDVGSRLEIYRILRDQAAHGAVVVVSSDAAELEGLCDRVLVMSRGRVVKELTGDDVTEQRMTQAALTATRSSEVVVGKRAQSDVKRFLTGDFAPPLGVLVALLALGLYTSLHNDFYLTKFSIQSVLALFAALGFAAMAQQTVMLTGGIDLSVGPAMSFLVVVGSFWLVPGIGAGLLVLSLLGLIVLAAVIAVLNWIPTLLGVPAFVVTLVTFTALQGLALWLRPTPAGTFDVGFLTRLGSSIGWVPWAAVVVVVVGVVLEVLLRRSPWGARVRAVGSNPVAAYEAGVRVPMVRLGAYLIAALLVVAASLLLTVQVGSGDATVGIAYTLAGITAAVVGGASIFGGRGSMLGALAGALLIQQINTATVFLGLDISWQSYLLGGLTLIAAGFYSMARGGTAHVR
ncbi:MAG: ribose transport system permease protein rbsA [Nocardioidaceae bacterium]|nr:ribose transport system permease protein rbsA [Nocardioidaceae bacterium]